MKQINTEKAPAAIGPYSQAIEANNMVFVSGQLPIDPSTGNFVEGGAPEQARQSLTNAKAILNEAGLDLNNVIKTEDGERLSGGRSAEADFGDLAD